MSIKELLDHGRDVVLPDRTEVWELESEEADEVFETLASETARRTLAALYEHPRTTSAVAEALDTSLQNANYHISNLRDAGLIEVAGTEYSDQGNEMDVYAPVSNGVVLLSTDSIAERIRNLIPQMLAVGLVFAIFAAIFRLLVVEYFLPADAEDPSVTDDSASDMHISELQAEMTAADAVGDDDPWWSEFLTLADELPLFLDPAVTFVLGGLLGITMFALVRYARR